jgi:outer membrane receptor protein involved in Fe transport
MQTFTIKKNVPLLAVTLAGLALGNAAVAQDEMPERVLEEIVVTATKREQSLQDVAISVNVMTGDKMNEAGINNIENLSAYVPNLIMSETGIGNNIYIRGIGSGINPGVEQSSAMFVDGIHYGRGQLYRAPLFDMQRVEVLRGPQSILFGKNAISGAISVLTAQPTDEFEGSISALYEPDHEEQELSVVLSGPLGDSFAARLAVRKRDMAGYISNPFLSADEPDRDELTVRGTLRWDVTDRFDATLKYERNKFDVTGRQVEIIDDVPLAPGGLPYSQIQVLLFGQDPTALNVSQDFVRSSNLDFSNNESDNVTLTLNYDFANDVQLTAISGYLEYEFSEVCDCDFSSAVVLDAPLFEDYDQFSQELRLTSPGGDTVDWIVGAFFQTNEQSSPDVTSFPSNSMVGPAIDALQQLPPGTLAPLFNGTGATRSFTQETDSWSVFGQVTWNVSDIFRLNLGLRYTDVDKEGKRSLILAEAFGGAPITPTSDPVRWATDAFLYAAVLQVQVAGHDLSGSRNDTSTDFSVVAQWDVSDDVMLYGSVASGFKAGGFDTRSNKTPTASSFFIPNPAGGFIIPPGLLTDGTFEFEDETALSYEVGAKMRLAGGAADLNLAAFFTEYDDLQISQFDGGVGFNVGNAAAADIVGFELDGRWQISEKFGMFGSVAWLDFEFTKWDEGVCYVGEPNQNPNRTCNRTGATNQYVADYSGAIGFDFYTPVGSSLEFRAALDVNFTGDYFTAQNNDPVTVQDAYAKVNLRVALGGQSGNWELALLGRNLTDEAIVPYTNPVPLASTFGGNSHYAFIERPRSVAVQATFRF